MLNSLGYGLEGQGIGVCFPAIFSKAFVTDLGPTQFIIQWAPGALLPGIKSTGHEATSILDTLVLN
jgi:hypothetical protein